MTNLIKTLGARPLSQKDVSMDSLLKLEKQIGILFPTKFSSLLKEIGDAIVFDHGAMFIPSNPTGREDAKGYLGFEVIYGGRASFHGLYERNQMFSKQLPDTLVAIGESPGGDQICLNKKSFKVFFWKHDTGDVDSITEIFDSIELFLKALVPDDDEESNLGIISATFNF